MKKSEIDALKKAFNIPEPENKEIFISSYKEKLKINKRPVAVPVIMRYVSTAVAAALIVGLWGSLSRTSEYREKFQESSSVIEMQTEAVTEDITDIVTTSPTENNAETEKTEPTTAVSTDAQVNKPSPQATTAVSGGQNIQSSTEAVTNTSAVTQTVLQSAGTQTYTHTAVPQTTTKVQSGGTVSSATTAREETRPVRTTTAEENLAPPVTGEITEQVTQPAVTTTIADNEPVVVETTASCYEPGGAVVATTSPDDPEDTGGYDRTVTPSVVYDKNGEIYDGDSFNMGDHAPPSDFAPPVYKARWKQMADNSDHIVYGMIDEVIYTAVYGMPYTQLDITIFEAYITDSKLDCLTRISVYMPGGYMPASEYRKNYYLPSYIPDDAIVEVSGGNAMSYNAGEEYIFFLENADGIVPERAYVLTDKTDLSIFMFRNGKYYSAGDAAMKFNESELKEYLTA
ncbi:MAG: hypothetical protein E7497_03145 [Ruminococcus sp.]|nr:hypothetical protein [Ruminococcus sp.]